MHLSQLYLYISVAFPTAYSGRQNSKPIFTNMNFTQYGTFMAEKLYIVFRLHHKYCVLESSGWEEWKSLNLEMYSKLGKHFLQVWKFAVFVATYKDVNYITSQWFIVDKCFPVRTKLIIFSAAKHQKDGEVLPVAVSLLHINPHVLTRRRLPV